MRKKLLLLEDDAVLSDDIKGRLLSDGFDVDTAFNGAIGERMILQASYDCILLDVNMPGKTGYEVAKSVREAGITTPIIFITSFGSIGSKMQAYNAGADDFITKPFHISELLARILVMLKWAKNDHSNKNLLTVADLVIDIHRMAASRKGISVNLTGKEFAILRMLAEAGGSPVSKQALIKTVWAGHLDMSSNAIEVFISLLRNKVDKGHALKLIRTRIGVGYYLGTE